MSGGLTPDEQQTIEMTGAVGYYENRQEAEKKENAGKSAPSPVKKEGWTFRGSKILAVLSSLRLAISLFLILAFLTIFGTFIEQGRDAPFYIAGYGEKWGGWIVRLKVDDIYHSWYYVSLLTILCINAVSCVYNRFPITLRSMFHEKVNVSREFLKKQREFADLSIPSSRFPAGPGDYLKTVLSSKRYKVTEIRDGGDVVVFGHKGVMGRIGSHVAHMSVILILAGGLIGSLLGFRLFGTFYVHSTTFVPQGDFSLRVNKFWIDHYPNGMVKGFFSDVDVLKSGKIIDHKVISVNHPLETNGLRFYQASYGEAWDRVDKARILIVNKEKKQFLGQVMLKGGALSPAPGTDLSIKILRYVADFAFDPKTNSVYSKSEKSDNPAIQLGIYQNGKQIGSPWLFYNFPQIQVMKSLPYFFILGGYEAPMYTGLEVAKDPGVHVILAGSFLLVGGLFLSSFVYHRKLWVRAKENSGVWQLSVGGFGHKDKLGFEKEFNEIVQEIQAGQGSGTPLETMVSGAGPRKLAGET
ncbi:cytochrome c biogenesis protein ResB [Leptospirillum ferrooxidans]|jgi:cytochrome c biogenesis protein|uniref:ResB-like family protein n=1 Tax=Leptospirillum ferrooxidans (strain C2-3) TaxID=1162668 RepID=I0IRB8_LEPFC|nr:cytochrome c biogenesis protein ResB [Leptospirillum ferrooxidans]BAM07817.1 ResB-like family protein [Leptospirillum ferrooxidans C2-3]